MSTGLDRAAPPLTLVGDLPGRGIPSKEPSPVQPLTRWIVAGVGAVVAVHALAFVALSTLQRAHADEVAPNVTVDGVDVGGLTESELEAAVEGRAEERLSHPVEVVAEDEVAESERRTLGVTYDTQAAVDDAWRHGRGWLWPALWQQIQLRRGERHEVALPRELDRRELAAWAADVAEMLSREPRSADVGFVIEDGEVGIEVTDPVEGRSVDSTALAASAANELDLDTAMVGTDEPIIIDAPIEDVEPPTVTEADLEAAVTDAERAVSAPVTLINPSPADDLLLEPIDLAEILSIVRDDGADDGERLRVEGEVEALRELLGDEGFEPHRADAVDASFEIVDGSVSIEGGTVGFDPDPDGTAELIVELATTEDGEREGEFPGEVDEPDFARSEAEELGIEQEVSSFSTSLVPGQPRNTNLQRAANLIDGSLILPGERFSLDEAIGPRTEERGFVENGYIDHGELISVVGGGVSQMGTTFMNAAWFAGIELVTFQPHSFYFQRYPMGREATLSWQTIDVVVVNDSPYGILVSSEADEHEVSVTFWSTPWAEVTTDTSDPYDVEEGEVRDGFTVDFERTITYPDGSSTTETYTHTYVPEDEPDEDDEDD
jgi:vancomycin resistance protein YoaR